MPGALGALAERWDSVMDFPGDNPILLIVLVLAALTGLVSVCAMLFWPVLNDLSLQRRISRMAGERISIEDLDADVVFGEAENGSRLEVLITKHLPSLVQTAVQLRKAGLKPSMKMYVGTVIMVAMFLTPYVPGDMMVFGKTLCCVLAVHLFASMVVLKLLVERRRRKMLMQMPMAVDFVSRSVTAGQALEYAIAGAADALPLPLKRPLSMVPRLAAVGMPTIDALWAAAREVDLPEFDFFVLACEASRASGGGLGDVLKTLSETIRGRLMLEMKTAALAAEGKVSAYVLGGFPVLLLGYFKLSVPDYVDVLFETQKGNLILAVAAVFGLVGFAIMLKIAKIKV